jgi:hypothetical protein
MKKLRTPSITKSPPSLIEAISMISPIMGGTMKLRNDENDFFFGEVAEIGPCPSGTTCVG